MYDIIHAVENGDLDEAVLDQRLDELLNVIFSTHQATEDAKGKHLMWKRIITWQEKRQRKVLFS